MKVNNCQAKSVGWRRKLQWLWTLRSKLSVALDTVCPRVFIRLCGLGRFSFSFLLIYSCIFTVPCMQCMVFAFFFLENCHMHVSAQRMLSHESLLDPFHDPHCIPHWQLPFWTRPGPYVRFIVHNDSSYKHHGKNGSFWHGRCPTNRCWHIEFL